MTTVSRAQYRPPPPPPEPKPAQQTQQAQQRPAVTEAKAADKQQEQNTSSDGKQTQPYVNPFDKSSYKPAEAASEPGQTSSSDLRNVRQTGDVDCGVGALATLGSANNPQLNDEQLRNQVRTNAQGINDKQGQGLSPVDLKDGINPQEMGQLAGQQGLEAQSFGNFDSGALEKHVTEGHDALMLVDTNALENSRKGNNDKPVGDGGEHWLVVDDVKQVKGADGQTEPVYSIKDPSTNEKYDLTRDEMEHVVNAGREGKNHTGGGLLVKQASTGDTTRLSMANANTASVGTTGDDDGTGPGSSKFTNTTN